MCGIFDTTFIITGSVNMNVLTMVKQQAGHIMVTNPCGTFCLVLEIIIISKNTGKTHKNTLIKQKETNKKVKGYLYH